MGIIHRDLKPANVLFAADGTAKITDFGLIKFVDRNVGLTQTEAILGTAQYMAPEQAWGKHTEVGRATDVYALGAILYELLTGMPPFQGETRQAIYNKVRFEKPIRPTLYRPALLRILEAICLQCLEKEANQRYANAQALADDLRHFLLGEPIEGAGPRGPG
jgi:serine/threonine-protein kinase